MSKPAIIFVGSFAHLSKTDHSGGMTKMCQHILDSDISDRVQWYLIDSTAPHNKIRSFITRLFPAIRRVLVFVWLLLSKKIDKVFIFTSQGFGFYEKGVMILIAKAFNKCTILALRSGFLIKDIESSNRFKRRAKHIFDKSDDIVVQGTNWKSFLIDYCKVGESKIHIIPNCVDKTDSVINEGFQDPCRLLFMGFVEKNKGIYELIKAIKLLDIDGWQLDIAGDGIALQDIKDLTEQQGLADKIVFHGWVKGGLKENLYRDADIIILPSYHEGMPNAILEAMARSTAVISTDVGAIPDLIDQGKNGFLIKPSEYISIAEKIKFYLQNSDVLSQHKEASRLKIENHFTVDRIIPKFAQLLIE